VTPAQEAWVLAQAALSAAAAPRATPLFNARPFARGQLAKLDLSKAGSPMPGTSFEGKDGNTTLAAYRGRVVVLNLWATWCAPCVKEMPALDRLARLNPDAIAVVAVSQDMAGWRVVDPFWARTKLSSLTPYIDKKSQLGFGYGARGLPLTVVYDRQGREVARLAAPADWDRAEGLALVRAVAGI
jgi:thiol-disulfide isomerase/thioredoxin